MELEVGTLLLEEQSFPGWSSVVGARIGGCGNLRIERLRSRGPWWVALGGEPIWNFPRGGLVGRVKNGVKTWGTNALGEFSTLGLREKGGV